MTEGLMRRAFKIIGFAALIAVAFAMVLPYLWMTVSAFKTNVEFTARPNDLAVHGPTMANFAGAVDPGTGRMGRYLFNSLVYATTVTLFQLIFDSLAAFAFARLRWRGARRGLHAAPLHDDASRAR